MRQVTYQTVSLGASRHESPEEGACVMELASMLAGEPFTRFDRHFVFVAERAGKPASTGVEHLVVKAEPLEYGAIAIGVAGRPLVTVKVNDRLAIEARHFPVLGVGGQENMFVGSLRKTAPQLDSSATTGDPARLFGRRPSTT
jgi:hypothetical protein